MNQPRYAAELTEQKIRTIVKAAPLHDIGKIGIPDAILLKPGKLSAGEFDIIKTHCQIGARILLVEDNQTNQEVTYQLLEAFGVTIEIVENGLVALEMVKKNPYDLILMDVQMPVMDGLQATAAIRQLPGRQNVPIIAMTANAYAEDRQKCLNAGMNDHLPNLFPQICSTGCSSTGWNLSRGMQMKRPMGWRQFQSPVPVNHQSPFHQPP